MTKEKIDDQTIKALIRERDINCPDEFLVIEDKDIVSFYDVNCKNIIFRNCGFYPASADKLFSNSYLENIILDGCLWHDSEVQNAVFKNMTFRRSIIYNNVMIENCIFDDFKFIDSLMQFSGFVNCEIKNTDFRGREYFFLQTCRLAFISEVFDSEKLNDILTVIKQNPDMFAIAWYNMKYTNCIVDLDSIKKLASYSNKIDPNFSWFAGGPLCTGYINFNNVDAATRYNLIANTFLYNADQVYDYFGNFKNGDYEEYRAAEKKYFPPLFFCDKIDLAKYRKTLSTTKKENPMTILDDEGREIDYSLIVPLGTITFDNSFYKDSDFVESHFDASNFAKSSYGDSMVYQKSLWQK